MYMMHLYNNVDMRRFLLLKLEKTHTLETIFENLE